MTENNDFLMSRGVPLILKQNSGFGCIKKNFLYLSMMFKWYVIFIYALVYDYIFIYKKKFFSYFLGFIKYICTKINMYQKN